MPKTGELGDSWVNSMERLASKRQHVAEKETGRRHMHEGSVCIPELQGWTQHAADGFTLKKAGRQPELRPLATC